MIFDKITLSLITAILGFGIWNIQRFMEDRKNAHAKVLKQDNLVAPFMRKLISTRRAWKSS